MGAFRFGLIAPLTKQLPQCIEACCDNEVLWTELFFPDRQRPLIKGLGLVIIALDVVDRRQANED